MLNERVGIDVKLQIEGLCSLDLSLEKSLAERVKRSNAAEARWPWVEKK